MRKQIPVMAFLLGAGIEASILASRASAKMPHTGDQS